MEDRQEDVVAEEVDLVEEAGTFFLGRELMDLT